MPRPSDPRTPSEWQESVDAAHVMLAIHSARCYGLVAGRPAVDVERCRLLLRQGSSLGYRPAPDAIDRLIGGVMAP